MEYTIIHDEKVNRFEIFESSQIAYIQYIMKNGVMDLTHTYVPKQLEGQGVGSALAGYVLDYARAEQLKVRPTCPFIGVYIQRNKQYQDLLT